MKELRELKEQGGRLVTISCDGEKLYYHVFLDGEIRTFEKDTKKARSACPVFPGAELYEREIMEKHGVKFRGHPNPVKLFT